MIPGARLPDGSVLIDANAPGAGRPFLGGFALDQATNAIFVLNGTPVTLSNAAMIVAIDPVRSYV